MAGPIGLELVLAEPGTFVTGFMKCEYLVGL